MSTLLIELLTEELPPKALARLGEAFARGLFDGLSAQGLLEAVSYTHLTLPTIYSV